MKQIKSIILLGILLCTAAATTAFAQTTISGKVANADDNDGIPGVSVVVKDANPLVGTVTDISGNYTITVPAGFSTLVFSYTGMATQEKDVSGMSSVDVTMQSSATDLDAVVVIGYGSQKKKEVTGSVSSVKQEDFNSGIKTNPMGLLQGKVAGLNVQRVEGGSVTETGFKIQIRGFSTLDQGAGTTPLYVVDGIPVDNIDNIAPDDIVSFDVLKDGSAAAIYGTRGTNGVIIITTKRGESVRQEGGYPLSFEYSGYASVSTRIKNTGMSTPEEFRNLSSLSGGKFNPVLYKGPNGETYNTDWVKEVTRPAAITHNHSFALSGAGKNLSYRGSLAYKDAQGIAQNNKRSEIIAKLAMDQYALDGWLQIQYDLSYMHYRNDYNIKEVFEQAAIANPTYPIYDSSTGSGYYFIQGSGQQNPVEMMRNKESYQDGNYFRGSIRPTIFIKPVEGLKLSAFAAFEEGMNHNYWYNDILNFDIQGSNMAGRKPTRNMNRLFEGTIDYANNFGKHNIAAVAGISYQHFENDELDISNGGFPTNLIKYYSMGDGDATRAYMNMKSFRKSNTLAAGFARVNYSYDERYLLSASLRYEGSSRMGANNKWGWFPAASVGWRIKNESFLKDVKFVNDMKLRFGFGITGNNVNEDLRSEAIYEGAGTFWYNGQWVTTYAVTRNANPDLRWEKKIEYNLGFDFALWHNRLYGSIDAYYRNSKDLLWLYNVPSPPYQFNTLLANAGAVVSKGIELSLNIVPVRTQNFSWVTTPTLAFNQSKITKLSEPELGFNYDETMSGEIGGNGINGLKTQILIEGQPIGAFWGYHYVGINEAGYRMYEAENGGYTADPLSSDPAKKGKLQMIGSAQPLMTFGWNNNFRYKNWDLSLFFRGSVGGKLLNVTRLAYGPNSSQSMNVFMEDVASGITPTKSFMSDYYLEDGSYIKLDNVTLGYTPTIKQNKFVRNLRIYFTAQNVFTLTGYSGIDPEVDLTAVKNAGIDYINFYPNVRSFILGLNITLN